MQINVNYIYKLYIKYRFKNINLKKMDKQIAIKLLSNFFFYLYYLNILIKLFKSLVLKICHHISIFKLIVALYFILNIYLLLF